MAEERLYGAAAVAAGRGTNYSLTGEKVIETWYQPVKDAAGKAQWVLDTVEQRIKEVNFPGVVCHQAEVSAGGFMAEKRDFLVVSHNALRDYRMYIGARDIGTHLETC